MISRYNIVKKLSENVSKNLSHQDSQIEFIYDKFIRKISLPRTIQKQSSGGFQAFRPAT